MLYCYHWILNSHSIHCLVAFWKSALPFVWFGFFSSQIYIFNYHNDNWVVTQGICRKKFYYVAQPMFGLTKLCARCLLVRFKCNVAARMQPHTSRNYIYASTRSRCVWIQIQCCDAVEFCIRMFVNDGEQAWEDKIQLQ